MMVNLLDDSNFHRQTAVMTRLIEMIIQNPVFGIFYIISMLVHPTSQYMKTSVFLENDTAFLVCMYIEKVYSNFY
jgi:hypothetical protein